MSDKPDHKDKKKRPKKVTKAYLERAALFYLERYSSSRRNLERVLDRKVRRRHEDNSAPSSEEMTWIKEVAEKCASLGYVDDVRYASQKAQSMHLGGKSERAIKGYLRQKGVSESDVQKALETLKEEEGGNSALKAAIRYARKRGFGPFRMREADDDRLQKDIASMLRAGHQFDHVQKIIKCDDKNGLEDILYE